MEIGDNVLCPNAEMNLLRFPFAAGDVADAVVVVVSAATSCCRTVV